MKIEIKRMYDAIKAIEIEELKKKVEAVGDSYEFDEDKRPCLDVWNPASSGETITVYINSVSLSAIDTLEFDAEIDGSYEKIALNVDAFMYEGLSYIADEIQYPRSLWMRIDCTVRGTKKQMDTIMKGVDSRPAEYTIKDMLNNGQVEIDGGTYIPEDCVQSYNEQYGENYPYQDIDIIG